ncbi:hypothetical protein C0J52_08776 [Blattella germanica]|nr:hypothetical protein C0J52_08776 [Blattella germanica]
MLRIRCLFAYVPECFIAELRDWKLGFVLFRCVFVIRREGPPELGLSVEQLLWDASIFKTRANVLTNVPTSPQSFLFILPVDPEKDTLNE